ncbi:MAG: anthranilate synthase component I family protein, partial [Nitrospirota bacterium]|nr:anthranilate synthase component I family protein [Nitrospirota bacterium]
VKGTESIAGYSFIGIEPYLVFKVKDGVLEIDSTGRKTLSYRNPVERLKELVNAYRQKPAEDLPPFQGGAVGMFSYDFVHYLEKLPQTAADDLNVPDAHFFLIDRLVAFDHLKRKCWIIVCPGARETMLGYSAIEDRANKYIEESEDVLREIHEKIIVEETGHEDEERSGGEIDIIYETPKNLYMDMVRRAKEYIAAGDIFQANLSLRLSAETGSVDPWKIYTILRTVNPSPFASYIDFGDYHIVSSSPERLVRVKDKVVDTRPIAGTRSRGKDLDEDEIMRSELLLNEKERAEHIMLIDLERNDLGRVSDYGTVIVDELMITEDYSHVIHIVSNVRGELTEGKDCFSVIRSAFPGGTITGVPKVRCMEIIDEIEPTQRGPYTGSIGYIGFNGNMDLNIIIRTFLIKEGKAYVQAGAGIVADSDPEHEYYESLKKAEALIKTLELL